MANHCINNIVYKGSNYKSVYALFKEMSQKENDTGHGQLPDFVEDGRDYLKYMFSVDPTENVDEVVVNCWSKWSPPINELIEISKRYPGDWQMYYEETAMYIYGRLTINAEGDAIVEDIPEDIFEKIDYNDEKDVYVYDGKEYESMYDILSAEFEKLYD